MIADYRSQLLQTTLQSQNAVTATSKSKQYCQANTQQTREVGPVLFQYWSTVCDAGPALKHGQRLVFTGCELSCAKLIISLKNWFTVY